MMMARAVNEGPTGGMVITLVQFFGGGGPFHVSVWWERQLTFDFCGHRQKKKPSCEMRGRSATVASTDVSTAALEERLGLFLELSLLVGLHGSVFVAGDYSSTMLKFAVAAQGPLPGFDDRS